MKKPKLSFDITDENREILEKIKKEHGTAYGNILNALTQTFADIPHDVKKELTVFVRARIRTISREMGTSGKFRCSELAVNRDAYEKMAKYLGVEDKILQKDKRAVADMKSIPIKNGILICPGDYIVVNPEEASACMYAGVVECRNSDKFGEKHFGEKIPHFIYFCNKKYGNEYDEDLFQWVNQLCINAWPYFKEVIGAQVDPIYDPDNPKRLINASEWVDAPTIGYFAVYEHGDEMYGADYQPPEGVRIIRKKKR